jgi:hypothetical protein
MFDRERKVEVTPRPGRWRGDDRFGEIRVRKGVITLELETHYLEIATLAFNVLRRRGRQWRHGSQD